MWRIDLGSVADEVAELLSVDERARAERFMSAGDGRLWMRARGVLRTLIGRYVHSDPRALTFLSGPAGKPAVPGTRLSFNLSHSGSLALYAFASSGEVGVDVEAAHRSKHERAIAARLLEPAERQRLAALDPRLRRRELMRRWTRHEARLKCLGGGIGGPRARAFEPWVAELDVHPRAAGAVASELAPRELRRWEWA